MYVALSPGVGKRFLQSCEAMLELSELAAGSDVDATDVVSVRWWLLCMQYLDSSYKLCFAEMELDPANIAALTNRAACYINT